MDWPQTKTNTQANIYDIEGGFANAPEDEIKGGLITIKW
jgi:hypothetical protein